MQIYNSMTRKKETFKPIHDGKVGIYACGPTVYNYFHIGNARPFITFDVLRRQLEREGYEVTFVQNFTDIDDKMIRRANEEGITVKELADRFINEYYKDAKALGIRPATVHPKATEHIPEIIALITKLIENGHAYASPSGDVYYRVSAFLGYGKLSGQNADDRENGASERLNVDTDKESPEDFALWKAQKPGEPAWDSPWGKGRPGWHIECSAMAGRYLGKTIDIHCGGQDLIFPHHENEIAQSECCNGVPFANYWMHNGYINVDNVKMSKSLGNFFTVREVAEKFGYEPIRYLMISSQYRSPINYSIDIIEQCKAALERLYTCRDNLDFALENAGDSVPDNADQIKAQLDSRREQFIKAMDDDLNTADGISAVFELVKDINVNVINSGSKELVEYAAKLFDELTGVLGLVYNRDKGSLDDEIEALIEARTKARAEKNWAEADRIRDELKAQGIVLEDTAQGVKWHRE